MRTGLRTDLRRGGHSENHPTPVSTLAIGN
jgi:hypothetical protein